MNPKLRNYTRSPDGMFRRRVEFDVHNRPELVDVVYLVRAPSGELRKSETVGWRYKKERLTASTH
jgi:hypothetical protein